MGTQTVALDVMAELKQQPNTPEQNVREHLSQEKFNQRNRNYRNKDHSREEKRKRHQQIGKEKIKMYVGNLYKNVTESDLVKFFCLRTTNYLTDNCTIEMSNLQQNGRHNGHVFILAPCHVYNELVKLHGLEFHCRKIIIEEAKTPPKTLLNELSATVVANDQENMHKLPPTINELRSKSPATPREEQSPIQNINSTYSNAVIPKKKNIALFLDSIP